MFGDDSRGACELTCCRLCVIVGGLIAALVMSVFLVPKLYVWIAGETGVLPEGVFEEGEHIDWGRSTPVRIPEN